MKARCFWQKRLCTFFETIIHDAFRPAIRQRPSINTIVHPRQILGNLADGAGEALERDGRRSLGDDVQMIALELTTLDKGC